MSLIEQLNNKTIQRLLFGLNVSIATIIFKHVVVTNYEDITISASVYVTYSS